MATPRLPLLLALCSLALPTPLPARTKMTALPPRDTIAINLNNEGYSLVSEERIITLQQGGNRLDFSWQGVSIQPDSIFLQILDHPDKVRHISTETPPNENALVFNIYADEPFRERMRITYLISGLSAEHSYFSTSENDESAMDFRGWLKISNHSGEDFRPATLRIGTSGQVMEKELESGEAKKFLFAEAPTLKFKKVFYWDSQKQPHDPELTKDTVGIPMFYEVENKKENNLGKYPIPYGKLRIYQKDKKGETAFTGEDWLKFTPVNEKFKIYLGDGRDLTIKRKQLSTKDQTTRTNSYNNRVLYDTHNQYRYEIENFKDKPLNLTIIDHFDGHYEILKNSHPFKKKDATTVEFELTLEPKSKLNLDFNVIHKNRRD